MNDQRAVEVMVKAALFFDLDETEKHAADLVERQLAALRAEGFDIYRVDGPDVSDFDDACKRIEEATRVLDAWAVAIRGNWGGIDGRTCRMELNEISAYLRGERDSLTLRDVGVCDLGKWGPHWDEGRFSGMHEGVNCNEPVGGEG